MRNRCLCLGMVLLGICLFLPQNLLAQSTISCNSDDERRHSCTVDTRGGVRLLTQHSGSACTEGYSWGADHQGIWVDHGCRADFGVGGNRNFRDENRNDQYGGNGQTQTIACNSDDEGRHSCSADTRGGVRNIAGPLARRVTVGAQTTRVSGWTTDAVRTSPSAGTGTTAMRSVVMRSVEMITVMTETGITGTRTGVTHTAKPGNRRGLHATRTT
jgi:hypothetical protein